MVLSEPLLLLQSPSPLVCSHSGLGAWKSPGPAARDLPSGEQHFLFSAASETTGPAQQPEVESPDAPTLPSAWAAGKGRLLSEALKTILQEALAHSVV